MLVSSVFALAVVLMVNMRGPLFYWDSNLYLVFAEQMTHGLFDREAGYAPLMVWMFAGLKFLLSDGALAISVYFFLIWVAFFHLVQKLASGAIMSAVFALAFVYANPVSEFQFAFFLTEPAYSVLLAISVMSLILILFDENSAAGREPPSFAAPETAFLVSVAMLPLQRYVGGYMAVYLGIAFLLGAANWPEFGKRFRQLMIAALPFALVIFWNMLATGYFSGGRQPAVLSFWDNSALMVALLVQHFPLETFTYLIAAALVMTAAITTFHPGLSKAATLRIAAIAMVVLAPMVQLVAQTYASSVFHIDEINERYVIVIVPVVAALLIWAVTRLSRRVGRRSKRAVVPAQEALWLLGALAVVGVSGSHQWDFREGFSDRGDYPALVRQISEFGDGEIAVIERNQLHLFASDILLGKFSVPGRCQRYTTSGSYWMEAFRFAPDCETLGGPDFVPVVYNGWDDIGGRFAAAILGVSNLPGDPATFIRNDAPPCVSVSSLDGFTLFDLRSCPKAGP